MALNRARVVCEECHNRKVRCDLRDHPDGICYNCRRNDQVCRMRRRLPRKSARTSAASPVVRPSTLITRVADGNISGDLHQGDLPISPTETRNNVGNEVDNSPFGQASLSSRSEDRLGYIGDESVLAGQPYPPSTCDSSALGSRNDFTDEVLRVTGATALPNPTLSKALVDTWFEQLYHRLPIVDAQDVAVDAPSVLLMQALCLVGSMLRHPSASQSPWTSAKFYHNAKTLLYLNVERDNLTILKSVCLMGCWSNTLPNAVGLDSPWSWTGAAIRLAYQLGLHKESSYTRWPDAGVSRRIWWHLYCFDKLQAGCYGRPPAIKTHETDVRPPALQDFEVANPQAQAFIYYTKLCLILDRILAAQARRRDVSSDQMIGILESLSDWVHDLPEELRLYDGSTRTPYRRIASENFLLYFICIILLCRLCAHLERFSYALTASIVASSCMVRLFEEMSYRDGVVYFLPVYNWFCMVASVPQIYQHHAVQAKKETVVEELDIIRDVLKQLQSKWPSATVVLNQINRMVSSERAADDVVVQFAKAQTAPIHEDDGVEEPYLGSLTLKTLFPFPPSMCPNMNLLTKGSAREHQSGISHLDLPDDDFPPWIFDNIPTNADFFDMHYDTLQLSNCLPDTFDWSDAR